jgi:hypothetical protein
MLALADLRDVEHKSRQQGITADHGWILQTLDWLRRTVHIDAGFEWIDEPAQLSAIRDVLVHLVLKLGERIARRYNLSYKVRTYMRKSFEFLLIESLEPDPPNP